VILLDSGPFRDGMLAKSPFYGNVPVSSNGRFVREVCRFLRAGFLAGVGCSCLILDPFVMACLPKARFMVTFRCPQTAVSFGRCVGEQVLGPELGALARFWTLS
jgi:hypothetical protein